MSFTSEKHLSLIRSLCILRHLQREPARRDSLISWVQIEADPEAYADIQSKRAHKQFENDIARLRDLGTDIEYVDGEYHLHSYGDFSPAGLSEQHLDVIAFLQEAFGPGVPKNDDVQSLLHTVIDWLPESQRESVPHRRQQFRLDLRRRDEQPIDAAVSEAVDRALRTGRRLRFRYRSPGQADEQPRAHTVEPWHYLFDTFRGHLYLHAYWLESDGPHGRVKQGKWQRFRMDRILPVGMELLPDKLPPTPPPRPRIKLEYLLSPVVARGGQVTRHFGNMQVHEADAQGWVRVTATTDNLFQALQLLLGYGPNCRVIGGPEARREMRALIAGMATLYREETVR